MKTLSAMKDEVSQKAQDTGSTITSKMDEWFNVQYKKFWMNYNWREITTIDEVLVLKAASVKQILPKEMSQLITFTERATNAIIQPSSPFAYQQKYLSILASAAAPIAYVEAGRVGVEINLSVPDTIRVVSTSSSDTHNVRITGYDSNNLLRTEAIVLNGTSNVDGLITFKADGIIDVVQAQRSTGVITISETTSATVMDRIGTEDYKNEYTKLSLQGPADSARTVHISYKQRFRPLRHDEDVPKFDCSDALIHWTYAQTLKTRGKFQQALSEENESRELVASLVTEKEILGSDYEETIPKVSGSPTDIPYFAGGRF